MTFEELCEAGDFEAAAALMPIRTVRNTQRVDWVELQRVFGVEKVTGWMAIVLGVIEHGDVVERARMSLFNQSLNKGYDLSDPKAQAELEKLKGLFPAADVDAIKAMGVSTYTPTASDAQAKYENTLQLRTQARLSAMRMALDQVVIDEDTTLEQVVEVITTNWPKG